MKSKKKELAELKEELEWIYQNITRAARQRAGMSRRIAHLCDRISQLEKEIENGK